MGVKRVCVPNRSTKSPERKCEQKKRWFRHGQRWRTASEARISITKRRHGLRRSVYPGDDGMHRWVGLGVIADTRSSTHKLPATTRRGTIQGGGRCCHEPTPLRDR